MRVERVVAVVPLGVEREGQQAEHVVILHSGVDLRHGIIDAAADEEMLGDFALQRRAGIDGLHRVEIDILLPDGSGERQVFCFLR